MFNKVLFDSLGVCNINCSYYIKSHIKIIIIFFSDAKSKNERTLKSKLIIINIIIITV